MPLASLCLALLAPQAGRPIDLSRRFTPNQKLAYSVTSHITAEQRQKGLQTFIPSDLDIDYGFSYVIESLKADGIAVLRFQQPSTTETEGETAESMPKPKVEKSDKIMQLTVSPVNEVIDRKDVTPPKAKRGAKKGTLASVVPGAAAGQAPIFGEYVGEMHRLALFVGVLDFSPRLPLEPVKVGDSWKRTVGYQPQKLKSKDGKSAVQRLDYTYTYLGPMTVDGKPVLRVQAKLDLNTDLADYLKTMIEGTGMQTNLMAMPLHMKATIDFDLDPRTRDTLSAAATSEGGFELYVKEDGEAYVEERFKGRTNMALVGRKVVAKP